MNYQVSFNKDGDPLFNKTMSSTSVSIQYHIERLRLLSPPLLFLIGHYLSSWGVLSAILEATDIWI